MIKLWKENQIADEYEITITGLAHKFKKSKYYKRTDLTLDSKLLFFITAKDGLNSTFSNGDWDKIYTGVKKNLKR